MKTLETQCPATPFCSKIGCWFCTANVFNPHCQPRTALITIAVIIYGLIALLHTLCYVPIVLGLPCRVFLRLGNLVLHNAWRIAIRLYQRLRHPRPRERHPPSSNLGFIPLVLIILTTGALTCQDVDIFEHKTTVCSLSKSRHQICQVDITEVIKLNTFSKEACLRLHYQGHLVKEIRLEWMQPQRQCEKQTITFTRHAQQKVLDAKRCAHAGSCVDEKCAGINSTAFLPELYQANHLPGLTFCVESCGGPGWGCFYMSVADVCSIESTHNPSTTTSSRSSDVHDGTRKSSSI